MEMEPAEIDAYIATGEPLHCAGSFTIDGLGGAFIRKVDGDPHAVVGLSSLHPARTPGAGQRAHHRAVADRLKANQFGWTFVAFPTKLCRFTRGIRK